MSIIEILIIAVSVSMDAFAVSICKGFSIKKTTIKQMITVGLYFGVFQAIMPLIGFFLGFRFKNFVMSIDHWIAFFLLSFLGVNMIREAKKAMCSINPSIDMKTMFPLAIATSIDALTIGITFSMLDVNIYKAITIIGFTTFLFSSFGVKAGSILGSKSGNYAQRFGGFALIFLGIKILIQHLGLISF
ncbi:MAG: manganese efflux pump MntP family protein [Peptoniphilaceae bacterium]|nr:manganese efflux pump MntP family protein [Peptoniphilaceae bacterium]MDD7383073.1 manganese efflux pump MntP family protein [Peptoniphilaceae bacterium]MDY3737509.1 manganese efflux pump MntP family protein [Peptoniphilaceae bacterium]